VVVELPDDKAQRKAVIVFLKMISTAAFTAIATWRLGLLLGIEPDVLEKLLALGLPLVGFFLGGVFCLAVFAWIVGVLPALGMQHVHLQDKAAASLTGTLVSTMPSARRAG
jgi:hypothetical protein